ncbi:MAG TPA: DUF4293 domain-containing protein [Bacteroidia bacterium]
MIQRIQSLFIALIIICGCCLWIFPFVSYQGYPSLLMRKPADILPIANYLSLLLALVCLFLYKNRKLQVRLCHIVMVVNAVMFFVMILFSNQLFDHDFEKGTFLFSAYLPLVVIVASYLASRYIKKDEELVRSADRIR